MDMLIEFPGGAQVTAKFGPYTVVTDQSHAAGGKGEAPTPFMLFLASLGTCAGIYVLGFCRQRGLPTEGIQIMQKARKSAVSGMIEQVDLEIQVPPGFPEKYHASLIRSADLCAVKKHIENPPRFSVTTQVIE